METQTATAAISSRGVRNTHADLLGRLVELVSNSDSLPVPDLARECATHALLDWTGVALAGMSEPAVQMLLQVHSVQLSGSGKLPPFDLQQGMLSALISGTAGHALDYDDVNSRMHGHPSVPVVPAALAAARSVQTTGQQLLDAIVVGHEVEALIGEQYGAAHYRTGFHATGTIGTFGAAAAAARILQLSPQHTRNALGLAAAQAAGLKSMFGTMTKPLHAGKAAMNGLLSARLARVGFTANEDAIEGIQGFVETQCQGKRDEPAVTDRWAVQDTLYKYHASCYLTHSSIEALKSIRCEAALTPKAIAHIDIHVAPGHDRVCNIPAPATGLEIKFSLRHLAAMVIHGMDTADLGIYTDANATDLALVRLRDRVRVHFTTLESQKGSRVIVTDQSGVVHERYADVGIPNDDLRMQWQNLQSKCRAITRQSLESHQFEALAGLIASLGQQTDLLPLYEAITL
mgnify:CR=1 FL=1